LRRADFGLADSDVVLTLTARFNAQKDHKTLIRAMAALPDRYKLLLLGQGELEGACRALAQSLGVAERVRFMGFQRGVAGFLKLSDVFVLSTNFEGLPLALVEAMACGKPVVASDVDGVRGVVDGAGLLFERGNAADLSEKLRSLEDRARYEAVAAQCLRASARYDLAEMAEKYLNVYHNVTPHKICCT
jgi:glycosyltransferase involved in cell wall biosynthesis